jgi:hypothetical protein
VAPLFAGFAALAVLYVWQAFERVSPTVFSDELSTTQIARAIAETGQPARRGSAYEFTSLVPWLTAPFWWIDSVSSAFDAIKAFQALVMTAAVFPAYGIARLVVSRPWAWAAGMLSVMTPALAYAPVLKDEAFGYTAAATAVLLIMRAVAVPSRSRIAVAVTGVAIASVTRTELAALLPVLVLSLGVVVWHSERLRRRRSTWSRWDWTVAALAGAFLTVAAYTAAWALSGSWRTATTELREEMWEYGVWAVGAWAVGIGVIPAVAILAALVRSRERYASERTLAFTVVTGLTVAAIVLYAAIKAATISTDLGPLIVERNVIYLTPLAATALVSLLAHRDTPWWSVVSSGAVVLYVVSRTPIQLGYGYYESHGVAILAFANREWSWSAERIDGALTRIAVAAPIVLLALSLLRRHIRVVTSSAAVLLACAAVWGMTAEIWAFRGERVSAATFDSRLPQPRRWIDEATGGRSVTVLGQSLGVDPTVLWLTEFWNRSIVHVWSVDGSAPGPGPTLTPDLTSIDGTLSSNAGTDYALALNGVDLVGEPVASMGPAQLVRLKGGVLRLRSSFTGVGEGAWTGPLAAYNQFDVEPGEARVAVVTLSRSAFCANVSIPSEVVVRIGPLAVGSDRQPALARQTAERSLRVTPCRTEVVELPAPPSPWRVEVESETFVPHDIDASLTDRRELGVQVAFASRAA